MLKNLLLILISLSRKTTRMESLLCCETEQLRFGSVHTKLFQNPVFLLEKLPNLALPHSHIATTRKCRKMAIPRLSLKWEEALPLGQGLIPCDQLHRLL
jgi:hypothetical protein